jgi:hypothetical protein
LLAIGGVRQNVDADGQRRVDLFLYRGRELLFAFAARPGQLPQARQILGAVDDAGAAAEIDAPQRLDLRFDGYVDAPHGVLRRQQVELVLGSKDALTQLAEAAINPAAAAGVGEDKAAPVDVLSQVFYLFVAEFRLELAADVFTGLPQIIGRGVATSTICQVRSRFHAFSV